MPKSLPLIFLTIIVSILSSITTVIFLGRTSGSYIDPPNSSMPLTGSLISDIGEVQTRINTIASSTSESVVSIIVAKDFQTYRSDPFGFFYEQGDIVTREIGGGTGVIITADGKILTNKHVVADPAARYIVVTADGRQYAGQIVSNDPITDLAIIQIVETSKNDFVPARFIEDESSIQAGDFAIAVGNTLGEFDNSVTFGIVSSTGRSISVGQGRERQTFHGLIQTDAAINQGNSGGPLLDIDGNVVGINTATTQGGVGVGFAIPFTQKQLDNILQTIEQYGEIRRAYLGIYSVTLDAGIANELGLLVNTGAYIPVGPDTILPDTPAARAGLKPGDVITSVDDVALTGDRHLQSILSTKLPGDIIDMEILRGSQSLKLEVELGSV